VRLLASQGLLLGLSSALLIVPVSAIFLSEYGSSRLPYTYVVVAVLGAIVSLRISGALTRISIVGLAVLTTGGLAVIVAASWVLLRVSGAVWTSFALWVLFPLQIQLGFVFIGGQAGRLLDVQQIKRYFPRVVFGFVSGFLVGGLVAIPASSAMDTRDMLVLTAIAAGLLAVLFWLSGRRYPGIVGVPDAAPTEGRPKVRAGAVMRDRYVMALFVYQFLSAAGSQVADFLLFDRLAARYAGPETLAEVGGALAAAINLANILFLALAAGFLLTRFGVRFGLMANPAVVAAMTGVVLITGVAAGVDTTAFFMLAVGTRVIDVVFTDGTTRTSVNAALQAVPPERRFSAQTAIEGIGVPAALGVVGVMLIVFDALNAGTMVVTVSMGLLCLGWLAAGAVTFRGYRTNIAIRLRRREIAPASLDLDTAETAAVIDEMIDSGDPVRIRLALDLLAEAGSPRLPEMVERLVTADDPAAVAEGLRRHDVMPAGRAVSHADGLASSGSPDVRAAAAMTLCEAGYRERALPLLEDPDAGVRIAAARALRAAGASVPLEPFVSSADASARREAVAILAGPAALDDEDRAHLARLRADGEVSVAADAIRAGGHHPEVPLEEAIAAPLRPGLSPAIAEVVTGRGDAGARVITDVLSGRSEVIPRWRAARAAGGLQPDRAIEVVGPHVADTDSAVRHAARQVLATSGVGLAADDLIVVECLEADHARAVAILGGLAAVGASDHLLRRALDDALTALTSDVALLADAVIGSSVASRALRVIRVGTEAEAATAEETLEVTLGGSLRQLLRALTRRSLDPAERLALLGAEVPGPSAAIATLLAADGPASDPWLRACAVWWTGGDDDPALIGLVEAASGSADRVVAETAAAVLSQAPPHRG
jgi:hypothetical protein